VTDVDVADTEETKILWSSDTQRCNTY